MLPRDRPLGDGVPAEPPTELWAASRGLSITLLLFLFGASLIVPSLGFTAFLLERNWRAQENDIERRLEQVAADLGHDIDRDLTLLLANLATLAVSPDVAAADWGAVHGKATGSLKPLGIELLYRDRTGRQLMNTRVPWGTALPHSVQAEIDAAVRESLKPHISDIIIGNVAARPVITLTAPVTKGEDLSGFLHMSIDPERFLATMQGQNLPAEWITGLSDRKGVIIARLQRHRDFVGKSLPEELRAVGRERTGVFRTTNVEGVETLRAVYRSPLSGWLVSANIPQSVAYAASFEDMMWIVGLGVVLLLLALAMAVAVGRLVAGPIRAIVDFAGMVEKESVPPPLRSPVREANEIAATLRSAAERLQERTRALRGTLERFNFALRGADIVVFAEDRERRLTWISETAGHGGQVVGLRAEGVLPADAQAQVVALEDQTLATGEPQEGEVRYGSGEAARYFRVHVEPVRDGQGEVTGLLGVSSEITALKQSERRNAFLVRELAHRSKNLLAVVQAIATETMRGSAGLADFNERFASRVRALAKLQDLAVAGSAGSVPLAALVRTQLEPFSDAASGRVRIDGPDVRLTPEAGNSLAMVLHELATNAAKYGALANATGHIELAWQCVEDEHGKRRFRMTWRERGGPAVVEPQRRGFGRKVVGRLTAAALGAEVTLDYPADGLVWGIDAPEHRVVAHGIEDESREASEGHAASP